jgi:hypothetical protein
MTGQLDLDPRWRWVELCADGQHVRWVRESCRHLEVVPVESVTGEVVAQLCQTCDQQMPAPRVEG